MGVASIPPLYVRGLKLKLLFKNSNFNLINVNL